MESGEYVDVIGCVNRVGELAQFTSKSGKAYTKRTVLLLDRSAAVEITLWGDTAEKYTPSLLQHGTIVAVKSARISTYDGITLSANALDVDPKTPEADELKRWITREGGANKAGSKVNSLSSDFSNIRRMTIAEAKKELGMQTNRTDCRSFSVLYKRFQERIMMAQTKVKYLPVLLPFRIFTTTLNIHHGTTLHLTHRRTQKSLMMEKEDGSVKVMVKRTELFIHAICSVFLSWITLVLHR